MGRRSLSSIRTAPTRVGMGRTRPTTFSESGARSTVPLLKAIDVEDSQEGSDRGILFALALKHQSRGQKTAKTSTEDEAQYGVEAKDYKQDSAKGGKG